jgi:hypothetical protein
MPKEINLVMDCVAKGAAAVEKETQVLWSLEDLLQAQSDKRFQNDDRIAEPAGNAVTSLYPGCINMIGSISRRRPEPFAQTSHFVLFGLPK